MQQWEYQTVQCKREDMIAVLNEYGRDGWDVVPPVVWVGDTISVLLKRPVPPAVPSQRIETKE